MTEQAQPRDTTWPAWWAALGLMFLAAMIQAGLLWRATVPAPDCVRFVALAQAIQQEGPLEALQGRHEQPLFPLAVWALHAVLAGLWGDGPSLWRLSAQGVSSAALVLTVLPVYLFSRQLYGGRAAAIGGALFCALPPLARLGPQGIGDGLHLLFFSWAAWGMVVALRPDGRGAIAVWHASGDRPTTTAVHPLWMLVPGLATAAALLVRAEATVLAATWFLTGLLLQWMPRWRQPWRRVMAGGGCYLLGLLAVGLPYLAVFQAQGAEEALRRMLGRPNTADIEPPPDIRVAFLHLDDGRQPSFAIKESGSSRRTGTWRGLRLFVGELGRAFWYWGAALILYGLWATRRLQGRPADWLVRVFALVFTVITLSFVAREGYLQARHLAPLVALTVGCAGHGVLVLAQDLLISALPMAPADQRKAGKTGLPMVALGSFAMQDPIAAFKARRTASGNAVPGASRIATAIGALAVIGCLAYFWKPVDAAEAAQRTAGQWLAAQPPGLVIDTRGLSQFFSGHPTAIYSDTPARLYDPQLRYFVVEAWEPQADSDRGQTLRMLLDAGGEKWQVFAGPKQRDRCRDVEVYRWRAEKFAEFQARLEREAEASGVRPPGLAETDARNRMAQQQQQPAPTR